MIWVKLTSAKPQQITRKCKLYVWFGSHIIKVELATYGYTKGVQPYFSSIWFYPHITSNLNERIDPLFCYELQMIWSVIHFRSNIQLDESTARRQLKSPQSLSGRSIHMTLVTKWSWSWSWMTYCHPLCAMSIGHPILRYSYFKIWP